MANRHILFSETSPVEVTVSGYRCKPGEDYILDPGDFKAPFYPSSRPARLQRLPQGAIPDGATVAVRYSYLPQDAKTLCPHAPEAATAHST